MLRNAFIVMGVLALSPAAAQDPIIPAADPEALFTDPDPRLHANKQVVLHIMRELLQCRNWHRAHEWLSDRYIQHNPKGRSGRENLINDFNLLSRPPVEPCGKLTMPVVTVLTSGDIVGVLFKVEFDNPEKPGEKYYSVFYDQWRIQDGKADEHWDTARIDLPGMGPRVARE